jgi:hypothetical protein
MMISFSDRAKTLVVPFVCRTGHRGECALIVRRLRATALLAGQRRRLEDCCLAIKQGGKTLHRIQAKQLMR